MNEDKTLRECAKYAGVCLKTSFYMRHKILSAMENTIQSMQLSGITQIDEKEMNISFSGNHKIQDKNSTLPRKPYTRGRKSLKHKIKTDFTDRIMICTTVDRDNHIFISVGKVAITLGMDEVYSELLPGDKVTKVEELISKKSEKEKLAFVGDGINDAPVLTRADIGIAMGAMGSDAAIEVADVVLMEDDPLNITKAIKISRKWPEIVYQNIVFALIVKFACLGLGAISIANMWFAIFADVGVMILVILNAVRALKVHNL